MKRVEVSLRLAVKLVGKETLIALKSKDNPLQEALLPTGAKLSLCGEKIIVHGYASDGSDVDKLLRIPGGNCCDCNSELVIEVLQSAAGYYIGTFCYNWEGSCGGPHSRLSDYYKTRESAEADLEDYREW